MDVAQQHLFAPNCAQSDFNKDIGTRGLGKGPPAFLEIEEDLEVGISDTHSNGGLRLIVRRSIFVYAKRMIFRKWVMWRRCEIVVPVPYVSISTRKKKQRL